MAATNRFPTFLAAAALALLSATAAQAEYRVSAFRDAPGFEALLNGDYQAAHTDAAQQRRAKGFASDANRCVSELMIESLDQALKSCNRALRQIPDTSPLAMAARRANESVILSNRGVVLAVQGNLSAAEEDFSRALQLDEDNGNAAANLNHLRSRKVSQR